MACAQVRGGIQAFHQARPALVFVTSAGVERNALIGDDEAARKADIPIVQVGGSCARRVLRRKQPFPTALVKRAAVRKQGCSPPGDPNRFCAHTHTECLWCSRTPSSLRVGEDCA